MTISYINDIPAANNSPSQDQPNMLINTNAVDLILDVNHYSFNELAATPGGVHKKIDLPLFTAPAVVAGDQSSVIYTKAGNADSAHAQNYFKNAVLDVLLSGIRAYALCNSGGGVTGIQSFNVTSVVRGAAGTYTITLPANVVGSVNYGVFVQVIATSFTSAPTVLINKISVTSFTITITSGDQNFAFFVYQI